MRHFLDKFKERVLDALSQFGRQMVNRLSNIGVARGRVDGVRQQQLNSATNKVTVKLKFL